MLRISVRRIAWGTSKTLECNLTVFSVSIVSVSPVLLALIIGSRALLLEKAFRSRDSSRAKHLHNSAEMVEVYNNE